MNIKFSDSEFLELYQKGLSDRQIAKQLHVHHSSIWWRRIQLELPSAGIKDRYKSDPKLIKENRKIRNKKFKPNYHKQYIYRKNNPQAMLSSQFRTHLYHSIKKEIRSRESESKYWKALGYNINDLIIHLESKFKSGMNWYNYGTRWNIDHIMPIYKFKYETTDDIEFKKCWALINLRPVWIEDNIVSKYDKT